MIFEGATEHDYLALATEDLRVELIRGRLFIQSPASTAHERIFRFLLMYIQEYVQKQELGEVFGSRLPIVLEREIRLEPDLFYVQTDQLKDLQPTSFQGTPSFVVEILSPSTRQLDLGEKRELYQRFGVRELWLIDYVDHWLLQIYRLKDGSYEQYKHSNGEVASKAIDGLAVQLHWLWMEPPPRISSLLQD